MASGQLRTGSVPRLRSPLHSSAVIPILLATNINATMYDAIADA